MAVDELALRLRVSGRVQGVWFRGWSVEQATSLGLDGWVRNRRDGSVELVVRGRPAAVREMAALCWRGPPAARVDQVEEQPSHDAVGPGFRSLPTA